MFLGLVVFFLSGCSHWIIPSRMYKIDKNTKISSTDQIKDQREHIIAVDDEIGLHVFANKAETLINPETGQNISVAAQNVSYRVLKDSTVFLPGIGTFKLAGKTISEAEVLLQHEYGKYVIDPLVLLKISNKRVYVFKGGRNSSASVIDFDSPNATLIEALSKAGGIAEGRSDKIFLIRENNNEIRFYKIDLSVAENAQLGNIVMQSNDIIYVAPQLFVSRRLLEEITPLLSIATTLLLIVNLFK